MEWTNDVVFFGPAFFYQLEYNEVIVAAAAAAAAAAVTASSSSK